MFKNLLIIVAALCGSAQAQVYTAQSFDLNAEVVAANNQGASILNLPAGTYTFSSTGSFDFNFDEVNGINGEAIIDMNGPGYPRFVGKGPNFVEDSSTCLPNNPTVAKVTGITFDGNFPALYINGRPNFVECTFKNLKYEYNGFMSNAALISARVPQNLVDCTFSDCYLNCYLFGWQNTPVGATCGGFLLDSVTFSNVVVEDSITNKAMPLWGYWGNGAYPETNFFGTGLITQQDCYYAPGEFNTWIRYMPYDVSIQENGVEIDPLPTHADLNTDGVIGQADTNIVLSKWGQSDSFDVSGNGVHDFADLIIISNYWGSDPIYIRKPSYNR